MPQQLLLSGAVPPLPLKMVSAFFVLEDSTLSSGAIGVIPRSYNAGRAPLPRETSWNGSHALAVEARAGDVLLLRCDTWRIDMPRPPGGPATAQTLRVDYAERNIAQRFLSGEGALRFEYDRAVVEACDQTQKRLLGKRAHSAYD